MRILLVALLLTAPVLAQESSNSAQPSSSPGCGPENEKFSVVNEKKQHPAPGPQEGKALVYFFQDDSHFTSAPPKPSTLVGIDGRWVGATHANSYFYFSVEPGERHLCTRWQGYSYLASVHTSAALHFEARAGSVYYFRVKNSSSPEKIAEAKLEEIDSDEGQLLAKAFSYNTSQPKK